MANECESRYGGPGHPRVGPGTLGSGGHLDIVRELIDGSTGLGPGEPTRRRDQATTGRRVLRRLRWRRARSQARAIRVTASTSTSGRWA